MRPDLGAWHVCRKFLPKMALLVAHFDCLGRDIFVRCPCEFRLHRLAQSGCPCLGARIFRAYSRVSRLLRYVHVHFHFAGSRTTVFPLLVPSITILHESHVALLEVPVIYGDLDRGLVEILLRRCKLLIKSRCRSLHVQVLMIRSCRDPDEFLSKRSLHDPV